MKSIPSSSTALLLAAIAALSIPTAGYAQTWAGTDDVYSTTTNWSPNVVPTGAAEATRAQFNGAGNANVTLGVNQTARLAFNSTTTSYTLSGGSFAAGGGADMVRFDATNTIDHTVNSPMYFGGASGIINIIRNNSSANTLTMGGTIGGQTAVAGISNVLQFAGITASSGSRVVLNGIVSDIAPGRTGAGNLVLQKIGGTSGSAGNLILNGANTHTGGTEFYTGSGSLVVGNNAALGAGELRVYGGGLSISANTDLSGVNALANTVRFNGSVSNVAGSTDITGLTVGSNTVTVSNPAGLVVGAQLNYSTVARSFPIGTYITGISVNTLTLSNVVPTGASVANVSSGGGRFQIFGSGSGTHTITGSQNLELSGTMFLGSGRADAGTAIQNFNVTNTGTTTFSGVLTQENSIEGTGPVIGALIKSGAGTLVLSGANIYSGATAVQTGILNIRSANALGATTAGTSVNNNAALEIQGGITVGAEALNLNGGGNGTNATTGALRNISGDNIYGGLVTLGSDSRINSDSGTLTLSNTGTITGATRALTVGGAGNTEIQSVIGTTSGSLTKEGAGTVTLTRVNTFSGATNVNAGTLIIAGTGSINSTSGITVNGGVFKNNSSVAVDPALLTFTSGTIGGTNLTGVTLSIGTGLTVSPGNSPGTLLAGATTFASAGNYNWEILSAVGAAGVGYDTMTLDPGAALTIDATSANRFNINLWSLSSIGPDVDGNVSDFVDSNSFSWTIVATDQTIVGFATNKFTINTAAANGTGGFSNAFTGTFGVALADSNTNLVLTYTPIPEPSAFAALAGLGALGFVAYRRRKSTKLAA